MEKRNSSERGQVLVLLVFGIVGLLGFAALAIDGGMLYADRRHAQNSADTSALAAAARLTKYFSDNGITYSQWSSCGAWVGGAVSQAQGEAISIGSSNGYTLDTDISDNHGVAVTCSNVNYTAYYERYVDVVTRITRDTNTALVHFVYPGPLRNTVEAIARIRPQVPLVYGHAIVALNPSNCSGNSNGVQFGGSSQTSINGGGVFSNGCLGANGSTYTVNVNDGSIMYAGMLEATADTSRMSPSPVSSPIPLPADSFSVPLPNCAALPVRTFPSGNANHTIEPGRYNSRISWNNRVLTLNPGLYCLYGSPNAMVINGGSISGIGVTIYLDRGDLTIGGNVNPVDLRAPSRATAVNYAIPGVLIYMNPDYAGSIDLTGNNTSFYLGTILAPQGDVKISGSNGTFPTFNTQIIAYNVFVTGNATIDINFNDNENYQIPPSVNLQQ